MRRAHTFKKPIASLLMVVFLTELIYPNRAVALTTGPIQPEVMSFEPVGTTDMVNTFTGDFVYNIPLMDVEGYPINLSYHGGVNMEQEASWVGLGWNINPGVINRTVRGIPDDFSGETIEKKLHIKDEKTIRVGLGAGFEIAGNGDPKKKATYTFDAGANVTVSNYRGVSVDYSLGGGVHLFKAISLGVNLGVGSQSGADIDYNVAAALNHSSVSAVNKSTIGVSAGMGNGYNTRSGAKGTTFSASFLVAVDPTKERLQTHGDRTTPVRLGASYSYVPIGLANYVPVITNSSTMRSLFGRIKIGPETKWMFKYGQIKGMHSKLHYEEDGSRNSYGYLYLQNADTNAIVDFTRDHDGMYNKSMSYLPPATLTYDLYSINGQGTGGQFRPYRNDFGSVWDPEINSSMKSFSLGIEVAFPSDLFSIGVDFAKTKTQLRGGVWPKYRKEFSSSESGSLYEPVYFRAAGELTSSNNTYNASVGGFAAVLPDVVTGLPRRKFGSTSARDARGNLIYYNTAANAVSGDIYSYNDDLFTGGADASKSLISRTSGGRQPHHISEIIQLQKDGRRYCYGIPAMNTSQKEASFSIEATSISDGAAGLVNYVPGLDDAVVNTKGRENFYSGTSTPAFAHSYLLTSVLSSDYTDVTGDGVSDDDLGSFTKINYSLKEPNYGWKTPFNLTQALYDPGYYSDTKDDKANYVAGTREQWYVHSLESKNYISEFYISRRLDGKGVNGAFSYKLDSIRLFNKHDRYVNGGNAVPIKSVFFMYDYSLCSGVPNSTGGKLTLKRVYFRYGYSQKSLMSPYKFEYANDPGYSYGAKNRWGDYKPNGTDVNNYEFPYVDQNDTLTDYYAGAWSLSKVFLPSGGVINVDYEADDYAYVQDKQAMEMFKVKGFGTGPSFMPMSWLYTNKRTPALYAYFERRLSSEISSLSFAQNYLTDKSELYYNFFVKLAEKQNSYEEIRGYAEIEDVGPCPDGIHGYIKFKSIKAATIVGGGGIMHPVTHTALNLGRYSLPHILYPGSDPDESNITNIMNGLKAAFKELVNAYKNPFTRMLKKGLGRDVNLKRSYVRLLSPGMRKQGGGQRVKQIVFSDSWKTIAGGNEPDASYGKVYDYTIDDGAGKISSGVASYEPLVGGDENPHRVPAPYTARKGRTFPPQDPIELYQELPICESFYPSPMVGYRMVTVTSIHASKGKSAQGIDVYKYYTAKDYPVRFYHLPISHPKKPATCFNIFRQTNTFEAKQGYSLVLNDMHGKSKSIEHYTYNPLSGTKKPISYQVYNYRSGSGGLDNTVDCLVPGSGGMVVASREVGIETDLTVDSRQRHEFTSNYSQNTNLNVSIAFGFPLPIPLVFPWYGEYVNDFSSATATKIIQQYGILDNVVSYNEGALTTLKNELYDYQTGDAVVTSINNEYKDKEYSVSIPAAWVYDGMSPACNNINYEFDAPWMVIDTNHLGKILLSNGPALHVGDECEVSWVTSATTYSARLWLTSGLAYTGTAESPPNFVCPGLQICCVGFFLPRFPLSTPGWTSGATITNVHVRVVRSGARNMLDQKAESYTMLRNPIDGGGNLTSILQGVIDLKARTYSDSTTRIPYRYIANPDTINPFVIGERGIFKPLDEYAYVTNRSYGTSTPARRAGLYDANSLFSSSSSSDCVAGIFRHLGLSTSDPNWKRARTITKWSTTGQEAENVDAIGNRSTAIFKYNEDLPVAVATNAAHGDVLADGFEDYKLLQPKVNLTKITYSPFESLFGIVPFSTQYNLLQLTNPSTYSVVNVAAHTGKHAILATITGANIPNTNIVPVPLFNNYGFSANRYNVYYPYSAGTMVPANEYQPFRLRKGGKYVLSYWIKAVTPAANATQYSLNANWGMKFGGTTFPISKKTDIIDGWQQLEMVFTVPLTASTAQLNLPVSYYIDDVRIYPADANMKAFVYDPANEKLMATLDENNFATMYEYDQEGNLVRKKKETEKGVMTISESRSSNPAHH